MIGVLIIASALLHALWNALLRREADKPTAGVLVVAIATVCAAVVAGVSLASGQSALPGPRAWTYSLGAGVFEAIYFISLVAALERSPLPPVYTVSRGLAIAVVWPVSVALLGETLRPLGLGGTLLVCAGLLVSGLDLGTARDPRARRGVALGALSGLAIAGYHLCYKGALAAGGSPPAVFVIALAVALPANVIRLGEGRWARLGAAVGSRPLALAGLGITCAASFLLFLWALGAGGAGWVLTLRNTSVVFAVVLGSWLGEPAGRRQWVGALLVAAGALVLGAAG